MRRAIAPFLLLVSTAPAAAETEGIAVSPAAWSAQAAADRILREQVAVNGVPGMGAAVWRDGRLVWRGSAGLADRESRRPVEADTVFRLASVSKLLTATAAARLREEGRLDVDAPVRARLGWLPQNWSGITSRQLAAHISGLPHYQEVDAGRGGRRYDTVREAVGVFQDRPLLAPTGEAYVYSSWGYTLLSAVVEDAAGQDFLSYVAEVITPGLTIQPDTTDLGGPHASTSYDYDDGRLIRAQPHDHSYTWGGGGFSATASALATWGGQVLSGQIVSAQTLAWMTQPTRMNNGDEVAESGYKVGFGWRVSTDGDQAPLYHHAGVTIGARSLLMLNPEQKLSVSVLSNAPWVSAIDRTGQSLAAPFLAAPPGTPTLPCPVDSMAYEGRFEDKAVSGTARFAMEDGLCVGRLGVAGDNPAGAWLNGFSTDDAAELAVVGVTADGGLGRAALITPIGAYEMRALDDGRLETRFGAARVLTLRLTAASP